MIHFTQDVKPLVFLCKDANIITLLVDEEKHTVVPETLRR